MSHRVGVSAQLILSDYLTAAGIMQIVKNPAVNILGINRVEAVELADGEIVPCDCLIFCSGIKPNTKLARDAGLVTRQGIVVNDDGLTSDPDIYAIGECCEYQQKTHGVVSPGFTQALNCANHLVGLQERKLIEGNHIQVKFNDYTTAYFGNLEGNDCEYYNYTNRLKGLYRKLVVQNRRVTGAVIIGNWSEQNEVKKAFETKLKISTKEFSKI